MGELFTAHHWFPAEEQELAHTPGPELFEQLIALWNGHFVALLPALDLAPIASCTLQIAEIYNVDACDEWSIMPFR